MVTRTSLFPGSSREGYSEWKEREFSIRISSAGAGGHGDALPRPAKDKLRGVASHHGKSCYALRPEVVQKLLEECRFVKVKRLFMYMAEKHRHPWVEKLDLSRIDFGKGKRRIVSGGELNPKYEITVPREQREGTV